MGRRFYFPPCAVSFIRHSYFEHSSFPTMPTYVYETIPQFEGEPAKRFEIRQSMKDAALTQHPDSGQPVRRVPIGGTGLMGGGGGSQASSGGGSCGTGCGCH